MKIARRRTALSTVEPRKTTRPRVNSRRGTPFWDRNYLEFAELQALNRKPMYMADWIAKLDDFLQLSEREILRHAGRISHEEAAAKAELEYDRFASERAALPAPVEKHFEAAVRDVKQLETARRAPKARKPPASTRKKP